MPTGLDQPRLPEIRVIRRDVFNWPPGLMAPREDTAKKGCPRDTRGFNPGGGQFLRLFGRVCVEGTMVHI